MKIDQALEQASLERCTVKENDEIRQASDAVLKDPADGKAWMNKGLALSRQSYMREAEECFSMAIARGPFNWEFYRHRAHRFLSCWRFQDAAADFTIASRLNTESWRVWYHLGLSFFLLGEYEKALKAYRECLRVTDCDKDLIAVTDWCYMTLRRLGRDAEADELLLPIHENMQAGSNTAYLARLLMYKGLKRPEELLSADPADTTDLEIVTMGFGVGNYYLMQGETEKGLQVMRRVVQTGDRTDCYFAFAYLASKVELDRYEKAAGETVRS